MPAEHILTNIKNRVRFIILNRPEKKNAITTAMYKQIADILKADEQDDNIVATILTGNGGYFSSGSDLGNDVTGPDNVIKYVLDTLIHYPKILITVVNGPALGNGATLPMLCDIVYASDKASFETPFVKLGACTEGGASFTYPSTLGRSKASEVLLLNHKLSAQEAYKFGMVSKVIPHDDLNDFIENLQEYGKLSVNSVKRQKKLIVDNFRQQLVDVNQKEADMLKVAVQSKEFLDAKTAFLNRKSKL